MGIRGLLKALKPFTHPVHVTKYAGQRVGIDAYSWLHKGAYGCSMELCTQSSPVPAEDPSQLQYVKYCMHRILMLRYNRVVPVMVFDGGRLPLKAATENERQRQRQRNLELGEEHQARGDVTGAQESFKKAVEITPLMAHQLIRVLKDNGVEFVVAPYEADSQLAWLAKRAPEIGGVAAVISEDSDLLAYGCPVVIFKMDQYGHGEEISINQVLRSGTVSASKLSFGKFDAEMFLGMCVLAGCDFLPSIPGIGIVKAHAMVAKYGDLDWVLSKIAKEKKVTLPERYIPDFWQARAIFLHARVYDTSKRVVDFLNPLPDDFEEKCGPDNDFLGPELPQSRARAIAQGSLDPITMCAFNMSESSKPALFTRVQKGLKLESVPSSARGPFAFFSTCRIGASEQVRANQLPSKDGDDPSFAAQLQHMAVNRAVLRSTVLQEHNGLKRVRPPLPDNNPFKRSKQLCTSGGKENQHLEEEDDAYDDPEVVMVCETQQSFQPRGLSQHSIESCSFSSDSPQMFLPDQPTVGCETVPEAPCITESDVECSPAVPFLYEPAELVTTSQLQEVEPAVAEEPQKQYPTKISSGDLIHISVVGRSLVRGVTGPKYVAGGRGSHQSKNRRLPNSKKPTPTNGGILRFFKPVANSSQQLRLS